MQKSLLKNIFLSYLTMQILVMIVAIIQITVNLFRYLTKIFENITYLKRYYNFFDKDLSKFFSSELREKEMDENLNDKMMKIQQNDPFCKIKITALNNERKEDLEVMDDFKKSKND